MMAALNYPLWVEACWKARSLQPAFLQDKKNAHWQAFLRVGLPSTQQEKWKYTPLQLLNKHHFQPADLLSMDETKLQQAIQQHRLTHGESILIVLVNGQLIPALSDLSLLPQTVVLTDLSSALETHVDIIMTMDDASTLTHPFALMNVALFENGLFLHVPDQVILQQPIHCLSIATSTTAFVAHPHHVINLGLNSQATFFEEHISLDQAHPYFMNSLTVWKLAAGARVDHYKMTTENQHALHMAVNVVQAAQDASFRFTQFATGTAFSRDDVIVSLHGARAAFSSGGFYRLQHDQQYVDQHIDVTHLAPLTVSEMIYKGVLDQQSRAVFNGRLHVAKDAQKIVAYQANHNLLLSNKAEVYSKPELEIYADDVKCKHGATVGQLDHDALFYMRARGIAYDEAMAILLRGFAEDILQRITVPGIKLRAAEVV